nr:hypothetical protein [Morchella crassipes]
MDSEGGFQDLSMKTGANTEGGGRSPLATSPPSLLCIPPFGPPPAEQSWPVDSWKESNRFAEHQRLALMHVDYVDGGKGRKYTPSCQTSTGLAWRAWLPWGCSPLELIPLLDMNKGND